VYSEIVMDHFNNPRNAGVIEDADGVAAIVVSSLVSKMATGKKLDEAQQISRQGVAQALGGLPPNKMHCSNLGAEALSLAIKNYQDKKPGAASSPPQGNRKSEVRS
jgi:nitrogen fixation protein NifU and related proteins